MVIAAFHSPKGVETNEETLTECYGQFVAEPFERGWGTTVGNALRRVLLSSLEGAAISAVRIEGVSHEFTSIPGVLEDATDIVLNLKKIDFVLNSDEAKTLTLNVRGPKKVTAKDIEVNHTVKILNPDATIATLNEEGKLDMELVLKKGKGYTPAEDNKDSSLPIGFIAIDSIFNPVRRANFIITETRVGQATDYEKLLLDVWTNGAISPKEAIAKAADLLITHFSLFSGMVPRESDEAEREATAKKADLEKVLSIQLDQLGLSVRSNNCLKAANILTFRDLVALSEDDLLKIKNLGQKSMKEIQDILVSHGLRLGMKL